MIRLFKEGDRMGISTDCENEANFLSELTVLLGNMIYEKRYEGDWEFQFEHWLPQIIDIAAWSLITP